MAKNARIVSKFWSTLSLLHFFAKFESKWNRICVPFRQVLHLRFFRRPVVFIFFAIRCMKEELTKMKWNFDERQTPKINTNELFKNAQNFHLAGICYVIRCVYSSMHYPMSTVSFSCIRMSLISPAFCAHINCTNKNAYTLHAEYRLAYCWNLELQVNNLDENVSRGLVSALYLYGKYSVIRNRCNSCNKLLLRERSRAARMTPANWIWQNMVRSAIVNIIDHRSKHRSCHRYGRNYIQYFNNKYSNIIFFSSIFFREFLRKSFFEIKVMLT